MSKQRMFLYSRTGQVAMAVSAVHPAQLIKIDHKNKDVWFQYIREREAKFTICLMGCMVIIPEDICLQHDVYNLHPGDIVRHPQLKGKDPIERHFQLYTQMEPQANIIHRATGELDSGEVMMHRPFYGADVKQSEDISRLLAVAMWSKFLCE